MKQLIILAMIALAAKLNAQLLRPDVVTVAYFGETISHPGIKFGALYNLLTWDKSKTTPKGKEKHLQKTVDFIPSLGVFHHKGYQTGLFISPEVVLSRKKPKGGYRSVGLGAGYMRTFLLNVYDFDNSGDLRRIHAGQNYFLTNYSITFGKDLMINKGIPLAIYAKPQFMYALPNTSKGIWYFALEVGAKLKLTTN
jgi:hypothetical protein